MRYNNEKKSIEYFSNNSIPYRYLEPVGRKYIMTYWCKPIFFDIEEELKKLIGAEESGPGKDRNPFLVNYAEVSKLTRKVEDLQNSRADDKTKIDEFKQELSLSTDDGVKLNINSRISDIQNRLAEKSQEITELQKEIEIKKKEIDEKVANQRKEIEEFSNKIKEEEQK
jgi:hypothetical protein